MTQAAKGATWSLFLPGAAVLETALVFALSLRYTSKPFRAKDAIALVAVASGVVAWLLTADALWALLVTIAVDTAGVVLTMVKAHADPDSETLAAWVISALAAVTALSALGTFSWVLALYPVYCVAANAAVSTTIVLGRRRRLASMIRHERMSARLRAQVRPRRDEVVAAARRGVQVPAQVRIGEALLVPHRSSLPCRGATRSPQRGITGGVDVRG